MAWVDWAGMAERLGAVDRSGTSFALRALEEIVGKDVFRSAVEHYVSGGRGGELARSVLWHCRPWSAMQRCQELYASDADLDVRRSAVELLRVVADQRALAWIAPYLEDPDPHIQLWGAGVLDQLLWSNLVNVDDCKLLLQAMEIHPNEGVRERHAFVMRYLAQRETTA